VSCVRAITARQLAHELAATDAEGAPEALRRYEVRQRPRVEAAQDNSRLLAWLVLRRSRLVRIGRCVIWSRRGEPEVALGPIRSSSPRQGYTRGLDGYAPPVELATEVDRRYGG
jgi:2-polyprenyl-6-methoxyphenol hydroxylase-like FAD-dependent oxidoreductase